MMYAVLKQVIGNYEFKITIEVIYDAREDKHIQITLSETVGDITGQEVAFKPYIDFESFENVVKEYNVIIQNPRFEFNNEI